MVSSVAREEGARALFSGLTPALLGSAMSWGGFFYFYERFKPTGAGAGAHALASMQAGAAMVFLTNPARAAERKRVAADAFVNESRHRRGRIRNRVAAPPRLPRGRSEGATSSRYRRAKLGETKTVFDRFSSVGMRASLAFQRSRSAPERASSRRSGS